MDSSAERPLGEVLDAVAERTPAPGGGSASAWTGALAAALLEMSAAFAEQPDVGAGAAALRAELLGCAERELRSYEPVLAALRLGADDPSRGEQLSVALSEASDAPLAIARACAELAERGAQVADTSSRALKGDATAAVLLAEAACRAAGRLVEINLEGGEDPRLDELAGMVERAGRARAQVLGEAP